MIFRMFLMYKILEGEMFEILRKRENIAFTGLLKIEIEVNN